MRSETNRQVKIWILAFGAVWAIFALGLAVPQAIYAFGESSARSVGMGGAFTAVARNIDAVGWNPANLGLKSDRKFSVGILSVGAGVRTNGFSRGNYDKYNGKRLTEDDKRAILSDIPDEGLELDFGVEASALGVSYDAYAFQVGAWAAGEVTVPKAPFELLLFGNELNRTYRLDQADGEGWGVTYVSFSGARFLKILNIHDHIVRLSVGGTLKYLKGFGYGEVVESSGYILTEEHRLQLEGRVIDRRAEGGSGFALDLGVAGAMDEHWTFGLGLINLGKMSWKDETIRDESTFSADTLYVTKFTEEEEFEDVVEHDHTKYPVASFGTTFPAFLRLGVAYSGIEKLLLAGDYEQGLTEAPGVTTTPRISAGAEYRPIKWFAARTGLTLGGRSGIEGALGFGLGSRTFTFDMAVVNYGSLGLGGSRGEGVAMEMQIGF